MSKDDNVFDEIEELDNIVTLSDENGEDHDFEFLDLIEYKGKEYVVLIEADEESDEVVILEYEEDDEEESYISVESEEILNAVFEIFREKFKDEFDFTD